MVVWRTLIQTISPNNITELDFSFNKLEFIPAWVFLIKTLEKNFILIVTKFK